jgi:ring-1,2-phenylacetyl-CoA epoxidase subunit PaaC
MLRQYLFDAYENVLLSHLVNSAAPRVAEIAAKIRAEEVYHLRHTSNWIMRLGLGTGESHGRTQEALDAQWNAALQLFLPLEDEGELISANIVPDPMVIRREWEDLTITHLSNSGLVVPEPHPPLGASRAEHTEHLTDLLVDMQQVARSEEFGVEW